MEAQDKIYVTIDRPLNKPGKLIEYIRKDALTEWAKEDLDPMAHLQLINKLNEFGYDTVRNDIPHFVESLEQEQKNSGIMSQIDNLYVYDGKMTMETFRELNDKITHTRGREFKHELSLKEGSQKIKGWDDSDMRCDESELLSRFAFYTYKDEPDILYLSNLFVEESFRNKGIGTKILTAAEKVAETIGATSIRLKVKQNSPANAWYRKNGYGYRTFEDGYDWLEKVLEYNKPIPKTKGWAARDKSGNLNFFLGGPRRITNSQGGAYWIGHVRMKQPNEFFPDLKWEDDPIEVELTINRV